MEDTDREFKEIARDVRLTLEEERERLIEKAQQVEGLLNLTDYANKLLRRIEDLEDEVVRQGGIIDEMHQQLQEKDLQLSEQGKLLGGVAKTSSEDVLLKALRRYVNYSKRKTADKRVFAKSAVQDIATLCSLVLPEDLAQAVDSLDDEVTEPKVVTVQGNYNDIHDNGGVKIREE